LSKLPKNQQVVKNGIEKKSENEQINQLSFSQKLYIKISDKKSGVTLIPVQIDSKVSAGVKDLIKTDFGPS